MVNEHKKGEDVVNNFIKTLEKAKTCVTDAVVVGDSKFKFEQLRRSTRLIDRFLRDPRLVKARELLRAPATGEMNDLNSQLYGRFAGEYQDQMKAMGEHFCKAIEAGRTGSRSHLNKASASKNKAVKAWSNMVEKGFDQDAADALLNERINSKALNERKEAIDGISDSMKFFAIRGKDICNCIYDELATHVNNLAKR